MFAFILLFIEQLKYVEMKRIREKKEKNQISLLNVKHQFFFQKKGN